VDIYNVPVLYYIFNIHCIYPPALVDCDNLPHTVHCILYHLVLVHCTYICIRRHNYMYQFQKWCQENYDGHLVVPETPDEGEFLERFTLEQYSEYLVIVTLIASCYHSHCLDRST
jgi:hypothetical protein